MEPEFPQEEQEEDWLETTTLLSLSSLCFLFLTIKRSPHTHSF